MLAIDPATKRCGLAFFVDEHPVKTETIVSEKKDRFIRTTEIVYLIHLAIANFRPHTLVVEDPLLQGKSNNTMQRLLGQIEALSIRHGLQPIYIAPMTVKKNDGIRLNG